MDLSNIIQKGYYEPEISMEEPLLNEQKHFINCVEACLDHNLSDSLGPTLIDKVLILNGELDPLYPPDAAVRLAAEFNQTAHILSECSHGIVGLTAAKVQSSILQFLQT